MRPETSTNPVHAMLDRLANAVGDRSGAQRIRATEGGYAALLVQLVKHLRLSTTVRQLAEAKPHLEEISDFDDFRIVLLRLGLEAKRLDVRSHALREHHLPCLIFQEGCQRPLFVTAIDEAGSYQVAGVEEGWPRHLTSGIVYRVTLADRAKLDAARQRDGWTGPVLASFLPTLKGLLAISFVLSITGIVASLMVMGVYDFSVATRSLDTLAFLIAGAIGVIALEVALRRRRSQGVARLSARFDALVSIAAYHHLLALPLGSTDAAKLSTQLSRLRQFQIGRGLFGGPLAAAMLDLPFTILSFGFLFILSGTLAFIAVGLAVVFVLMITAMSPMIAVRSRASGELKNLSDTILTEIATKLPTIRDTATEHVQHKRALFAYTDYLQARHKAQSIDAAVQTTAFALMNLAGAAVLFIGAFRVMNDTLSIGALSAIMIVVWRVLMPIQTVASCVFRIKETIQVLAQIDQLMRMKTERMGTPSLGVVARDIGGRIEISNATLRYPGRSDFALKQVSLDIPRGHFVVVTGPSGSGKSTLVKMVLGLYQAQMGSIRVDGADLRHLDMSEYRQSLLYLPQEPRMLYGTVAQNVRLVVPEASDLEIEDALRRMGLTLPHPAFPDGIETRLRGRGDSRGSAAIHQKIALATVLVAQRPVMLLDSPGQHLDIDTDKALIAELGAMKGKSTIIMTTQRPSHMHLADTVVVLRDGAIAAAGPPQKIVPAILAETRSPSVVSTQVRSM